MKSLCCSSISDGARVALFTRAWIEILHHSLHSSSVPVALFTRAWIEMALLDMPRKLSVVALFTRAWIEIKSFVKADINSDVSPSLRGRGLKSSSLQDFYDVVNVALFTRAWIEIRYKDIVNESIQGRPLYEGVD